MSTLDELRALYSAMPIDRLRDAVAEGEASYRPEAWQIIQDEVRQRREDGRWQPDIEPTSADTPAPVPAVDEQRLTGVGGWLAAFVVVTVLMLVGSTFHALSAIASGEATISGTYRLKVAMASCHAAPCAYGVRLYRF